MGVRLVGPHVSQPHSPFPVSCHLLLPPFHGYSNAGGVPSDPLVPFPGLTADLSPNDLPRTRRGWQSGHPQFPNRLLSDCYAGQGRHIFYDFRIFLAENIAICVC